MAGRYCHECGSDDGTHYPQCSNEGGGAHGRKLDLSNVGAEFDLDSGAGPEEMERRTARAVLVCKDLDEGRGIFFAARSRRGDHLRAVCVLDAWTARCRNREWRTIFGDGEWVCLAKEPTHCAAEYHAKTLALARIAAADALVKEDPSLAEGL